MQTALLKAECPLRGGLLACRARSGSHTPQLCQHWAHKRPTWKRFALREGGISHVELEPALKRPTWKRTTKRPTSRHWRRRCAHASNKPRTRQVFRDVSCHLFCKSLLLATAVEEVTPQRLRCSQRLWLSAELRHWRWRCAHGSSWRHEHGRYGALRHRRWCCAHGECWHHRLNKHWREVLHHWRKYCDPCRSSCDVLHRWRKCCDHWRSSSDVLLQRHRCCDHWRSWCDAFHH